MTLVRNELPKGEEVGVALARKGLGARRGRITGAMPERAVPKSAVPKRVKSPSPLDTHRGKFVSCLVEAAANRLPGEVPALQICLPQRLFHLREQWQAPKARVACPVSDRPKVVAHYASAGQTGTDLGEEAQGAPASSDLRNLSSDGLGDGDD